MVIIDDMIMPYNNSGDLFDIREFHDQILQLGRVSLSVMEEFIDEWADKLKRSQGTVTDDTGDLGLHTCN